MFCEKNFIWIFIYLNFLGYIFESLAANKQEPPQPDTCPGLDLVPREVWDARPPVRSCRMDLPVSLVIIINTVFGACGNMQACMRNLQFIQNYHMDDKGWWGIAYNFLIGGDGRVYEGKGWYYVGEHTINYNKIAMGVAFMGHFDKSPPSKKMLDAAKALIQCGINKGFLTPSVKITGHRDATCTNSPGDKLYAIIKQWPNFTGGRLPLYTCRKKDENS